VTTLRMDPALFSLVAEGEKTSTVRRGVRRVAVGQRLTLGDGKDKATVVSIIGVKFKTIHELTKEEAQRDGFASVQAFCAALLGIYPGLGQDETLTLIEFTPVSE